LAEWLADKALNLILVPVITAIAGFLVNLLHSWAKAISAKKHMEKLNNLIKTAVEAMNQRRVDSLKGTESWTEEKQAEIFQAVKRDVMSQLKTDTQKALAEAYANPEGFIEMQIYEAVRKAKSKEVNGCG
jgi:predicted transcriptional regulator